MATGEHVVYKANQIARNLAYMGPRDAAAATADHLRKFWAPYLRSVLLDEYRKVVEWMRSLGITTADECRFSTPEMSIQTALGTESARPGDWIVRGLDGQFHVRRSHVLLTSATCPCRHRPDEEARELDRPTRCLVCDGGLAICALCGAAEIELDEPCAGPGGQR